MVVLVLALVPALQAGDPTPKAFLPSDVPNKVQAWISTNFLSDTKDEKNMVWPRFHIALTIW